MEQALKAQYTAYFLSVDDPRRARHLKDAIALVDARLETYDRKLPFHVFIRRVVHLEKDIQRRGMEDLSAWLTSLAQQVVDRYLVELVLVKRDDTVAMVLVEQIAQQVCRICRYTPGELVDPVLGYDAIWHAMLARVPRAQQEQIKDNTYEIYGRVQRGLARFQFGSTLKTWRYTIVLHTMASIFKRDHRHETVSLDARWESTGAEEACQPLEIADERYDPAAADAFLDALQVIEDVLRAFFDDSETMRQVIEGRLDGYRAKEIETLTGIPADDIHRAFHRFRRECVLLDFNRSNLMGRHLVGVPGKEARRAV